MVSNFMTFVLCMPRTSFWFTTIFTLCLALFYSSSSSKHSTLLPSSITAVLSRSAATLRPTAAPPHSSDTDYHANMSRTSRTITKAVKALEQSEGVGAAVRRTIGTPELRNLSPFLMLDHFRIGKGAGFSEHPHRGQATGLSL